MNSIKYLHAIVFLIHATSTLLINTLFSFLKERANTWLLHQKSEDFSVGHFKSFCSTGVQSYNGKPIFQQSTLSLPVISTWWTLFHRRQFVFVGKHYWHIIEQSRWKYIKNNIFRQRNSSVKLFILWSEIIVPWDFRALNEFGYM